MEWERDVTEENLRISSLSPSLLFALSLLSSKEDEEASSTAPCHHIIRCAPHPAEENVVVSEGVAVFLVHHHRREPLPSGILWGVSGALVKAKFKNGGSGAELWFACMV
ncbi:Camphor resistance CrcB-like protein [Arachis hypogaea]|nr:Camphor resistance CrcB-like protein [Arachis hypogaea]